METRCETLRERLLASPGEPVSAVDREHLSACAGCRRWRTRAEAVAEAVRSLPRQAAPAALDARVAADLGSEGSERRIARILAHLPRLEAPPILADLVFDGIRADRSPLAGSLRRLSRRPAPSVLERLVDEELSTPATQRARRFVGDLERLEAPQELEDLVAVPVAERSTPRWRLLAPSAGLAAAALVAWIAMFSPGAPGTPGTPGPSEGSPTERRFRVVRVDSASRLSPFARSFAVGLSGGAVPTADARRERGEAR